MDRVDFFDDVILQYRQTEIQNGRQGWFLLTSSPHPCRTGRQKIKMAASVGENSKWARKFRMAANDDEIPGHVVRPGVKGHLSHIGVIISHTYYSCALQSVLISSVVFLFFISFSKSGLIVSLITPMPFSPIFAIQWHPSQGFRKEWPAAVLDTKTSSKSWTRNNESSAFSTDKNFDRRSPPPWLHRIWYDR